MIRECVISVTASGNTFFGRLLMWPARIVGACFGGIGLAVLGFLWGSSWNDFHSPPLFFRVFGTFVAIPFVVVGATAVFFKVPNVAERAAALRDQLKEAGLVENESKPAAPQPGKLKCPNCGSSPSQAEVSPHGDVKCDHCSRWYNVHTA